MTLPGAAHILILRPGAIGDAIVTLPAVQRLKEAWPACRVTLVVGGAAADLLRGRCAADEISSYDEPHWAGLFAHPMPPEMHSLLEAMDLVLFYLADPGSSVVQRLDSQLGRKFVAWPALPPTDAPRQISLHLQDALALWGVQPRPLSPCLTLTDQELAFAMDFWQAHHLTGASVIALHPGSGSPRKNWPARCYAILGQRLGQERSARILVIAGPADNAAIEELEAHWQGAPPLTVRHASLAQVGALLQRCACLVGNDSGTAHLAAALGVPTIVLFGITDPRIWAPQGQLVKLLSAYGHPGGLAAISVEEVTQATLGYLP